MPRQYKKVFKLAAKKENIVLIDINQATKEDLVKSMELAMLSPILKQKELWEDLFHGANE
jgi:hypothetical protein